MTGAGPPSAIEAPDRTVSAGGVSSEGSHLPPLLVGAAEAARLVGLSRSSWCKHDSSGRVPRALRIGARKLWSVDELRDWIAAGAPGRSRWEELR